MMVRLNFQITKYNKMISYSVTLNDVIQMQTLDASGKKATSRKVLMHYNKMGLAILFSGIAHT